eukprot:CAMPEP_0171111718 /NCGR_PEP_ID=MMETSP0766_2-20121228/76325_1 /TAXON_ID=439317 /ORGANISM="Gambierdiscus australes, Strain CAWD 149" /LENGTH=52 /DNA_ID=CAMNT_0011573745 /DNA_START=37 /DNA_END=192 /DNA_ORIENTATION=-
MILMDAADIDAIRGSASTPKTAIAQAVLAMSCASATEIGRRDDDAIESIRGT